jgi:hypothetical protein
MDPLVLGLATFSAACFLAFALWRWSSTKVEAVSTADEDRRAPSSAVAAAPAFKPVAFSIFGHCGRAECFSSCAGVTALQHRPVEQYSFRIDCYSSGCGTLHQFAGAGLHGA